MSNGSARITKKRTMVSASHAFSRARRAAVLFALGSLAFLLVDKVEAQSGDNNPVGTTLCGCQPAVYEITLNFTVTCDESDVMGPGINETGCVPSREGNEAVTDLTPVVINEIQFLELNSALAPLQQQQLSGTWVDGNMVRYSSVLAVVKDFNETTLPRAFQMILRG